MREIDPRDLSGGYADTVDAALRYARMSPVERAMSGADTRDLGAAPRGHRPGGDPVQKHSAGDLYPYVIEVVENNGVRRYVVTGPGGVRSYADTDREATEVARWLKRSFDRGHPVLRGRPVQTLGEYLARKYDIPYPDSDGGEA